MTKRIILLDASTVVNAACYRKLQLGNRQGLQSAMGSDPLDFGQALHRGAADYRMDLALREQANPKKSIELAVEYYKECRCPKESPRTIDDLVRALGHYIDRVIVNDLFVPLVTPDRTKAAIEIPFKMPLYSNEHTDVLLSGVVDTVGTFKNRMVIMDLKHSATFDIKKHMAEQLTRIQFHIYSHAMHYLGYHDPAEPDKRLPIMIDGVYLGDPVRCSRSALHHIPDFMVDRTMDFVRHVAKQMAELSDDVDWPHNFDACQGRYRMCEFDPICSIPKAYQHVSISVCFKKRIYDPTTFGD